MAARTARAVLAELVVLVKSWVEPRRSDVGQEMRLAWLHVTCGGPSPRCGVRLCNERLAHGSEYPIRVVAMSMTTILS
jgi:hypothetical protein